MLTGQCLIIRSRVAVAVLQIEALENKSGPSCVHLAVEVCCLSDELCQSLRHMLSSLAESGCPQLMHRNSGSTPGLEVNEDSSIQAHSYDSYPFVEPPLILQARAT